MGEFLGFGVAFLTPEPLDTGDARAARPSESKLEELGAKLRNLIEAEKARLNFNIRWDYSLDIMENSEPSTPTASSTPSHHPTHGVCASPLQLEAILRYALPDSTLLSNEPLPHGSSYNNRLYRLTISHAQSFQISRQHLILKVTGRFWKHSKTLNEAMCLRLLSTCPALPVPRLVAFSADASSIPNVPFEWILMTNMPGSPISENGLCPEDTQSIATDLANFLSGLRRIRSPGRIGNLVDVGLDGTVELGGLVDVPLAKGAPYESHLKYQEAVFEAAMNILASEPIYEQNRSLLPMLHDFLQQTLPSLDCFHTPETDFISFLTHCDLSRRNILVHRPQPDSLLRLSAIVDWEFSGFFSPYEEYLTADSKILDLSVRRGEDSLSALLLAELAKLDVLTPQSKTMNEHWELVQKLYILRENTAPWWIRGLDPERTEVKDKLDAAQAKVRQILFQFAPSEMQPIRKYSWEQQIGCA